MDLLWNGAIDHVVEHARSPELDQRDLDPGVATAVHGLGGVEGHEPRGLDLRRRLRDVALDLALFGEQRAVGDGESSAGLHGCIVELADHERDVGRGDVDARGLTRQRIQAVLDELKEVGPSVIPAILAAVDRTQDEALRFQLWESACGLVMAAVADAASSRLRDPSLYHCISR